MAIPRCPHGSPTAFRLAWLAAPLLALSCHSLAAETVAEGFTDAPATADAAIPETPEQRHARMTWWRDAKFGLFLHWGVYAIPAQGEWFLRQKTLPIREYRKIAGQFNPTGYDPAAWAKAAQDAGMRYAVITAKHHDGFALFRTTASPWNSVQASPAGRDLIAPLADAMHAAGLKFGCYYSHAQDWVNPGGAKKGYEDGDGWDDLQKGRFDDYLARIAVPQVDELVSQYALDLLWFDTPMLMTEQRAAPFRALLAKRPAIITNNRLGGGNPGDYQVTEGYVPLLRRSGDWETCMTMNSAWGYADRPYRPVTELIHRLAEIISRGGNFLLNIGPTPTGEIPPDALNRLAGIGAWMRTNGESIYGTTAGPLDSLSWGCISRKGSTLYLHVFDWPADGRLLVPLQNQPLAARILASGATCPAVLEEGHIVITVPPACPDPHDAVIALTLDEEPRTLPPLTTGAVATASVEAPGQPAAAAIDGTAAKRWMAPKGTTSATLTIALAAPATVQRLGIEEPDVWPRLAQTLIVEAEIDGTWKSLGEQTTNGHGLMLRFPPVTARQFRIRATSDKGAIGLAEVLLYAPE